MILQPDQKSFPHHVITKRRSAIAFEPNWTLPDEMLVRLIAAATHTPSAYNAQNWRFIAVRSLEARVRLRACAMGQAKVEEASATIIVCGRLDLHLTLPERLQPCVDAGAMDADLAKRWVEQARDSYADNPVAQRDEAIRSGAMAAMTLMLAAEASGLASCPIGGFDASAVMREFELAPYEIPVVLVALGKSAPNNPGQKPRVPAQSLLQFM